MEENSPTGVCFPSEFILSIPFDPFSMLFLGRVRLDEVCNLQIINRFLLRKHLADD